MKKILSVLQSITKKLLNPFYFLFVCFLSFMIGYLFAPINVYANETQYNVICPYRNTTSCTINLTNHYLVQAPNSNESLSSNCTSFMGGHTYRIWNGSMTQTSGTFGIRVELSSGEVVGHCSIRVSPFTLPNDYCDQSNSDQDYCQPPSPPPDFRFPPGSPFCIDNPTSPLCVDEAPDGCNIGLGTGDCCTAFATNQCAGNGGVYWVNFTSGDLGESCTYECWGDQHNHPPEPDPGNHPGFPDRQSCEAFASNHCGGSLNVHMMFYNETEKTCSVTCLDGRGGTSPDPTVPIPGTNPGQTPTPGESTDLGVQRAIQRFHGDFNTAAGRMNQSLDNIDLNVSAQTGLLDDITGLLEEIRDKPTPGFDGELTIPGFDNLPGDFGDLDHDGDGMRGVGDNLGLDGDTTFDDIPERIIDISDYMGNFDLPSSGSCPTSFPVPLFGQVYNLDTSHMCRILEIVSIFLMMSAYVLSLRIVYGGLR